MKRIIAVVGALALVAATTPQLQAVELLVSADFETPGGELGKVPLWEIQEFLTGTSEGAVTAELTGGEDVQLWLRAFAGGGPLTPAQGNFENDNLPVGDVDGRDFLIWQRNYGRTDAEPTDGDANDDMTVDGDDLGIWQSNYGPHTTFYANARLRQRVPAVAGETYSFQGTSTFEEFYSGFVTTLGDRSPFGQIASPTVTQFKMEFLNSSGQVIGSPTVLDLRTEQTFPGFPVVHTPLTAVAPSGTTDVRVVAEALNMAWNGSSIQETPGSFQSAFFNDFLLTRAADPVTNLLQNGDLNLEVPSALDFWDLRAEPEGCCNPTTQNPNGEVIRTAGFANHTPGGSLGVWLSAFWGGHTSFEEDPVSGFMSQTVEAVAGGTYTFSGWTKFEANFSGGVDTISASSPGLFAGQPSPTETEIVLEFFDADGVDDPNGPLETFVIDLREERQAMCSGGNANSGTCGPAANGWTEHTLQAVAPAGTRFARLTGQMIDGVFNVDPGQSAFFDDFSLDGPAPPELVANIAVPEPVSGALMVVALATGCLVRTRRSV